MEESLVTWHQLTEKQKSDALCWVDDYFQPFEKWELVYGSFYIQEDEVYFASEIIH